MVSASAIAAKKLVTTTVATHVRVTFATAGWCLFAVEGLGSDPTAPKFIIEVYRGNSGGTPGAELTLSKLDSSDSQDPETVATVSDVFSSEAGYTITGSQPPLQRPTLHTQGNRQTVWFRGNAGQIIDCRLTQDVGGDGLKYAQVTTYIKGG